MLAMALGKAARSRGSSLNTATRAMSTLTSTQACHDGILEMREYTLYPQGMREFIQASSDKAELRKSLLPFLGMFTCDTGGVLNRVLHFYYYKDLETRDIARRGAASNIEWRDEYIPHTRQFVSQQESSIYLPAVRVLQSANTMPIQEAAKLSKGPANGPPALFELRQYQLHPGYGSVPKLIDAFEKGVPAKIATDSEGGALVYFGYSDVGILNSVIELWRYNSAAACIRARQSSRKVEAWRDAIAAVTPGVQSFRSVFLHPLPFSPLQ